MCQLSIYCLSAPNSLFISYAAKMDVGPLNIFPLPAGTMLSFVSRGYWREVVRRRGFPSWFWQACSAGLLGDLIPVAQPASPVSSFCTAGGFQSPRLLLNTQLLQHPAVSSSHWQPRLGWFYRRVSLVRPFPMNSLPNTLECRFPVS